MSQLPRSFARGKPVGRDFSQNGCTTESPIQNTQRCRTRIVSVFKKFQVCQRFLGGTSTEKDGPSRCSSHHLRRISASSHHRHRCGIDQFMRARRLYNHLLGVEMRAFRMQKCPKLFVVSQIIVFAARSPGAEVVPVTKRRWGWRC